MVQLLVFILYNVLLIVRLCPCFLDDLLYKICDFLALTHPNKDCISFLRSEVCFLYLIA